MQLRHSFTRGAFAALCFVGVPILAVPLHAQTQIVANGGFENDNGGDGNYFAGWTLSGNANQGSADDTFVLGDAHSGDHAAWLGAPTTDGFLSQTLATTPGTTYTVSYWLAVDSSNSATGLATPNDFSASFGGQTLFTQTNLAPTDSHTDPAADYSLFSYTAVATGTSSVLQFGFRDDPSEFRLDDVAVTSPAASAAPEPSAAAVFSLLIALGGGAALARRRNAAKG